jgi:hypothetical protein
MEISDQLKARVDEVEKRAKERFGDSYGDRIEALGRIGVNGDEMARVVADPNAVPLLDTASREALLRLMADSPDAGVRREAEAAYSRIRSADREAHRKMKAGR